MALVESGRQRSDEISSERLLRDDPKTAAGKIAIFQYLTVAVFIFLVSGFWKLQVQNPTFTARRQNETGSRARRYWPPAAKSWTATAASSSTTRLPIHCC